MPTRRNQGPPPIEVKQFTLDEIDAGVRKLRRRIDEVKALGLENLNYDDARVESATRNIKADIIDIFGRHSPEYLTHGVYSVGYPDGSYGQDDHQYQQSYVKGLPNGVRMLESLIKRLEEKREDLGGDKTARVRASFEGLDLHPRIAEASAELYQNRHYRNAVLDACLALEDYVKQKSRCRNRDGADLMRYVFSRNAPVLAFNALVDDTDKSEQEGMMHLFEGVMLALRNPRAHTLSDDSPEQGLEYIAFLSLLAKRLETATRLREP